MRKSWCLLQTSTEEIECKKKRIFERNEASYVNFIGGMCMNTQEQLAPVRRNYAEYTYRVRKYVEVMSIEAAVDKTIKKCIKEGIL